METEDAKNDEDNDTHVSSKLPVGRMEDACTPNSQRTSEGWVQLRQSPYLDAFLTHHSTRIVIDIDATGNMIRTDVAHNFQATITPSIQYVNQADAHLFMCLERPFSNLIIVDIAYFLPD
jgi:hypothetical protein